MKRRSLAFLLILLSGCNAFRNTPCFTIPENLDPDRAVRILRLAPRVEEDGIGIAGAPSCYVAAFRVIANSKGAAERFRLIFRIGTRPAKIYALIGLRDADPEFFQKVRMSAFARSSAPIPFLSGCVLMEKSTSDLVDAVTRGYTLH